MLKFGLLILNLENNRFFVFEFNFRKFLEFRGIRVGSGFGKFFLVEKIKVKIIK